MSTPHMNRRAWLGAGAALGRSGLAFTGCAAPRAQPLAERRLLWTEKKFN